MNQAAVRFQLLDDELVVQDAHPCRRIGKVVFYSERGEPLRTVMMNHHAVYYDALADAMEVSAAKNNDYAGGHALDPLGNFRQVVEFGVDPHTGLLCRMVDKWQRIKTFFRDGALQVPGEGIRDALSDLGNYCFLMLALLADNEASKDAEPRS